jgi:hypothetical protein
MTDGATTKTHVVTRLMVTMVDTDTDQVYGIAEPNATIGIKAELDNVAIWRDVPVDGSGNWVADFTVPVDGQTFDIVDGVYAEAFESDDDGDNTNFRWQVPYVPVCRPGTTVTGTVVGPDGEPINDATIHFDDFDTGEPRFITYIGANGAYGCSLPDGDYRLWADGGGYSREYYDETIFENATLIHVTAGVEYANVNFTLDTPSVTYDHLTFNMTDPIVGELAVRQAIAYGTDRARIIAATYPYSPLWDTYLPPDHWAHATSEVPQYDFDPQLARDILTAAGWVDEDGNGVREKNGVRLHIDYYTTWATLRATVSQIFVENMADIGIEVEVFALSPGILFASDGPLFGTHEFGIAQFAWGVDVNDDTLFHGEIFESQSENNVGLYNNPTTDGLLAEARAVGTRAEKLTYLQQHQALVMTDLATLPLFQRIESPPPVADGGPDQTVGEGTVVTLSGEGSSNAAAYHWEVVEAVGPAIVLSEPDTATPNFTAFDDGVYTFRLTVRNGAGATASDEAVVTVNNVAPTLGVITAPTGPLAVNTAAAISAAFSDPGVLDTHTAEIDWGDSSVSAGVVNETDGSGAISGSHTYTTPGVYTVQVMVSDDDGGSDTAAYFYVVVYDPDGGFVTGGGWINSPLGAYAADPTLTGKATFGFVAKYQKGANVPTGNAEFQFKAGNLNFKSTTYQWLVVAGAKAQFKGAGTINGAGDYGFMLTAIDGQINGGGGADKFRIKIWEVATGDIVYDNLMDAADTADPTTVIGGGSIVIHK